MKNELIHITGLLKKLYNADIETYDLNFLEKALNARMLVTQIPAMNDYIKYIENHPSESKLFLDSTNISYSEFFRNPLTFSILEKIVIPQLIVAQKKSGRKEIRIWSTACASGQEAYSIAMLLEEFQLFRKEKIHFRIFATDHSEDQINMAKIGVYTDNYVQSLTLKQLNNWFEKHGDVYSIKSELKKHIDFSVFDLFNKELESPPVSIFGNFDIVICANLLFYYKKKDQNNILNKLTKCISPEGYFITGETEREIISNNGFMEYYPYSAIFKASKKYID